LSKYARNVRDRNEKLRDLERQINMLAVSFRGNKKLRERLEEVLDAVKKHPASWDDSEINEVVETI